MIIERVSGQAYEDYVLQNILQPLDMSSTFFSQAEAASHHLAKGHQLYFGLPLVSEISYHRANLANGGILSSAEDLCQYLQAHLLTDSTSGPVLPVLDQRNDLFKATPADSYRKGWFVGEHNGKKFYSHGGQLSDYRNYFGFYPEEKMGVVVLVNQHSLFLSNPIGQISENVLQFLETRTLPKAASGKLNPSYWIFITLSVTLVCFFIFSLIQAIRSDAMEQLSDEELEKTRRNLWISNLIIPVVMLGWMWYLANYLLTSLHLAQPDLLLMVQLFFLYSLLYGLIRIYQVKSVRRKRT